MTQSIIAFTGISGVGKTTFLRKLQDHISFQHLTGGSLISKAREASRADRDKLRISDLDENQRLLIHGFTQARDPEARFVIMDGHVIIDNSNGTQDIPTAVFEKLGINMMVHLEAEPVTILSNRENDKDRNRPVCPAEVLYRHQERSRKRAMEIAGALSVNCIEVSHDDVISLAEILRKSTM